MELDITKFALLRKAIPHNGTQAYLLCVLAFLKTVPRHSPSKYAHFLLVGTRRGLCTYGVSLPCEGCGGYYDG